MEIFVTNSAIQGLETAFMVLGILVTFNLMGFPDITVEGSFPLGGAVMATLLVDGMNPALALAIAVLGGCMAGLTTGLIHTQLRVNPILAGILTSTAIYSVMLVIMGRPSIPLLNETTFFSWLLGGFGATETDTLVIVTSGVMVAIAAAALYGFLHTDLGFTVRAVGSNEEMIRSLGVNTDRTKLLALALSNGFVACGGALVSQTQGFADVNLGIGALVAAVASLILGESIFGRRSIARWILAAVVGAIVYRTVLNAGLRSGISASLFQLASSVIILVAVGIPVLRGALTERLRRHASHGQVPLASVAVSAGQGSGHSGGGGARGPKDGMS